MIRWNGQEGNIDIIFDFAEAFSPGLCQNAPLARMRRWRKNLKCSCTTCTLRFQNFSPPCLQTKSIILTQPLDSDTAPSIPVLFAICLIGTYMIYAGTLDLFPPEMASWSWVLYAVLLVVFLLVQILKVGEVILIRWNGQEGNIDIIFDFLEPFLIHWCLTRVIPNSTIGPHTGG